MLFVRLMSAFNLKPSLNTIYGASKLCNHKRLSLFKRNQNLVKPLLALVFFFLCIVIVPEKESNLASVCEKYNSSVACQVW